MNQFTTHKSALIAALQGNDADTAQAIILWLETPPPGPAKPGPTPNSDDDGIIISRPH